MTVPQHHVFAREDIIPSWWANAQMQFLSGLAGNILIRKEANSVRVTHAGFPYTDTGARVLPIEGRWRWVEADLVIAHPGGAAGVYTLWAVAEDNDIVNVPDPGTDATNYAFTLAITSGAEPAGDLVRAIAILAWSGVALTGVRPLLGPGAGEGVVGELSDYGGATDPEEGNWAIADGRALHRVAHAELFERYGTIYGSGDGSTTFNIPDCRGRVTVGEDIPNLRLASWADLGNTGGDDLVTLTTGQIPAHSHGVNDPGHDHTAEGGGYFINYASALGGAAGAETPATLRANDSTAAATTNISIQNAGGGGSHENMPPYIIVNKIVRVI